MQRKSFVIAAALVVGLGLGLVLSPQVRGTIVSAQNQPPAQTQTPAQAPSGPGNNLWSTFLDKLAATLNIQRSALDSAITSAGTSTVDEAVQQGTLTQAQADALKARIQAGDLGALQGGRGRHGGLLKSPAVRQAMLDAAAQALNLSTADLLTQLRNGQTLAQLAQANNTTEQAVTSAALAAAKTQLDQEVANGSLTQAQADAIYTQLQQRGSLLISPGKGRGGRGWHGGPMTPDAPTTPQTPTTTPGSTM